jgi:hypothetical protein
MDPTRSVVGEEGRHRWNDMIRQIPSRNFHLGIRLARKIGLGLNVFITFNFALTSVDVDPIRAGKAFAHLRAAYCRWARRKGDAVPPTFVWVFENPSDCLHAHWVVHVPRERQRDFKANLSKWLKDAAGEVYSDKAIKVKPVKNDEGLKAYLLKGLHPSIAKVFGIRHVYQGRFWGRRIGHSKNLGPVQVRKWRDLGVFPAAKRWIIQPSR